MRVLTPIPRLYFWALCTLRSAASPTPAPDSLKMVRMKFAGDKLPAFGSDGDRASFTDGVSLYAQELASASGTASSALVGAVGTLTKPE